jgi:Ca-activated chloride channel family protein
MTAEYLWALWSLPVLLGLAVYTGWQRRRSLARLGDARLIERMTRGVSPARRRWRTALILLSVGVAILALARPAWNRTEQTVTREGRDIVFVIDVSRSMLAQDLRPNRLERAKLAVRDCIETLEGDRVALIAFAGHAVVKCPLAVDYGFFGMMLDELSTQSVSRGGTMIGDAIRKSLTEVFDEQDQQHKDIILITDGEDQESFPVEAAAEAGKRGIRLLVIGLGDERTGQPIPITDEQGRTTFVTDSQGERVKTSLNATQLRKMVQATPGGRYLNVATGTFDLGTIYRELIASAEKRALEDRSLRRAEEKYQIFLGMAFVLLLIEMLMGERKGGER